MDVIRASLGLHERRVATSGEAATTCGLISAAYRDLAARKLHLSGAAVALVFSKRQKLRADFVLA
jgi:hypothetical protein